MATTTKTRTPAAGSVRRRRKKADTATPPVERTAPELLPEGGIRAQVTPHAAMAALILAAAAARGATHITGEPATVALATAGIAFTVAVVAAYVTGRRFSDRRTRVRAHLFIATAATWLAGVAATGLSLDAVGLLAALGSALHLYWWRTKRIPNEAAQPADALGPDRYMTRWDTYIGAPAAEGAGVLPGSKLISPEGIKAGIRYILRLVPGRQSYGTVIGKLENLRTGLRLRPDEELIVERHPVLDASCLLVTIVTKSPVKESIDWPGPQAYDPETGTVALGPFIDGEGIGRWRAVTENSLWGGFLCGAIGSGKSRMFESLALSLSAAGFVVWFACPQGGASSAMLATHADHVARTVPDILAMLLGLRLVAELREAENALDDLEGFTHSEDRPGLFLFIDECHKAFAHPQVQSLAATIAREGRKLGIAIVAASQVGTLDVFGKAGASDALRSSLIAGNLGILKCTSNNPKNIFGLDIDPKQFPNLPGYCYLVDHSGTGRSAPLRGYYLDDKARNVWAERIVWRGLDTGAASAYGDGYLRRREIAAGDKAKLREKVEALRSGRRPVTQTSVQLRTVIRADSPDLADPAEVPQFPTWTTPASWTPPRQRSGRPLHDGHRSVLSAMGGGHCKPKKIQDATGYSERQVHNLLGELVNEFALVAKSAAWGEYELTPAGMRERAA